MTEIQTISIFIPLLFLVVLELSSLARDIDLKNAVKREYHPFILGFWPGLPEVLETFTIPRLGVFNFIHGANFILLSLGIFWIRGHPVDGVSLILITMVWLLWVLLPIFEVEEYEEILNNGRPRSFLYHGFFATITLIYIILSPLFVDIIVSSDIQYIRDQPDTWVVQIYLLLNLLSSQQFLLQLENELEDVSDFDKPSSIN